MSDSTQMINELQRQLAEQNVRIGEYSEQILQLRKERFRADGIQRHHESLEMEKNRALAKAKAAQDNAHAAERKLKGAEAKVLRIQEQLEKVEAEKDFLRAEASELAELNAKV